MRRFFSSRQKKILRLVAGNTCEECGEKLGSEFHGDHIVPFSKKGATTLENGQALCARCNLKKGAKDG